MSSANGCCPQFDAEVARALMQANISVAVASPTFDGRQSGGSLGGGSLTNGGQGGIGTERSKPRVAGLDAGAKRAGEVTGNSKLDGVPCRLFSFFDCHAEHAWDECVAKRDACEDGSSSSEL